MIVFAAKVSVRKIVVGVLAVGLVLVGAGSAAAENGRGRILRSALKVQHLVQS